MLAAEQPPHQRVLRENLFRAPEPIRVPAPEPVARAEVIVAHLPQRAVVDMLERVVAAIWRVVDETGASQNQIVGAEDHAVEKIRIGLLAVLRNGGETALRIAIADVLQRDAGLDRDGARRDFERVAQGAVGIGKAVKKVARFVIRRAGHDATIRREHVKRQHRFVHQAMLER